VGTDSGAAVLEFVVTFTEFSSKVTGVFDGVVTLTSVLTTLPLVTAGEFVGTRLGDKNVTAEPLRLVEATVLEALVDAINTRLAATSSNPKYLRLMEIMRSLFMGKYPY
jgi:hypothetical protein